jgi:lipopolysaccharide transport system permease protein
LALRDVKVRYKQTIFGVVWVIVQPLTAAVIFTIVFGRLAQMPSEGLPYAVFVYAGVVLWSYFSGALTSVSQSLVQNRDLVTKTYFPAAIAPLALALPGLIDLLVSLVVLAVVMGWYGIAPSVAILLLPFWIVACGLVVLAAGSWLSALNVQYRDVRHTMTFLLQVWLFASPVVYAGSLVEGAWRYVYALNPMVTVLDGFRWSLVGGPPPSLGEGLVSAAVVAIVLAGGLVYFLRAERRFADLI